MDVRLFLHVFDDGADAGRLAATADQLRADLVNLGIGDVSAPADEDAQAAPYRGPSASRGIVFSVGMSPMALRSVLSAIRDWLRFGGGPGRLVRVELGADMLQLTAAGGADEERLTESFLERHLGRPATRSGSQSPADDRGKGFRGFRGFRGNGSVQPPAPPSGARDEARAEGTDASGSPEPEPEQAEVNVAADMPSRLQVGKAVSVACRLAREEIDAAVGRVRDAGRIRADTARMITIEVLPKANVEVLGEDRATVPVPGAGQASDAYFDIRATHPGTCQVWVVVRQGPVPLLTLRLEAAAILDPPTGPSLRHPAQSRVTMGGQTGLEDVTWLSVVEMDRGEDTVYRFELRSTALSILATFESPPLRHRAEYVTSLYREIEERWLSTADDAEAFQEELREFGGSLFSQLFPEQLQDILWQRRDSLTDLMVLSSEPFIPWELVHLKEPGSPLPDETRFLAETGLVRWLYTRDNGYPPQELHARPGRVRVLCPDYPHPRLRLTETRAEAQFLTDLLGASAVTPRERDVRALLRNGDFDVLHFAGHGLADSSDIANAKILLEGRYEEGAYIGSSLSVTTVGQQARLARPDGSRPMIMLNACQAGRVGEQMSSLGGFAQAFLDRGAGAFISSMWSVGDKPASAFVKTFYQELLRQQPVSAAASKARQQARQAGDGTWLAYAVYAHPQARLLIS